ncbi:MAG: hypothetical protein ACKV2T_42445 [Kofleriaceae bacterium]
MKHLLLGMAFVCAFKSGSDCRTVIEKEIACSPAMTDIAKDSLRNGDVHLCREILDGADLGSLTKVIKRKWEHEIACAQKHATCDDYAACKATFDE